MMTINGSFGETPTEGASMVNAQGEVVSPGQTLDRYPWERDIREKWTVAALKGRSYASPIGVGPINLGRSQADLAETLRALALHGREPRDTAMASVREVIAWRRTAVPQAEFKKLVEKRQAMINAMGGNVSQGAVTVGAPSVVDYVKQSVQATVGFAGTIVEDQGKVSK